MHRQARDVALLELHRAFVRLDHPDDHVEGGGLAGAVRAEQADDLAGADLDGDAVDHPALAIFLHQFSVVSSLPLVSAAGATVRDSVMDESGIGV